MASGFYLKGINHLLTDINWTTEASIKVALVITGGGHYSPDLTNDEFLSVITGADRPNMSAVLTGKASLAGALSSTGDAVITSPTIGNAIGGLAVYKDTGSASTSPLIVWIDLVANSINFVTNGNDIHLTPAANTWATL